jgi:hypothetical protein
MAAMEPTPTPDRPERPATAPEPGDRRPVLDRPPSARFEAAAETPSTGRPIANVPAPVLAAAIALAGSLVIAVLGGPLSVTTGLVAVAAVIGWAIGSTAGGARMLAVGLAVGSVIVGLVGIWLFANTEGGVLSLPDYLAEVQGVLVPLEIAVAGLVAAATAR